LKKLSKLVNIIPVLAKGDQYTKEEVIQIKENFRLEMASYKLDLYDCYKVELL